VKRRTRAAIVAAPLVVAIAVLAGLEIEKRTGFVEVPWAVTGTGPDGHTLLIGSPETFSGCGVRFKTEVIEQSVAVVRLRLLARDPACEYADGVQTTGERVHLDVALRGQRIDGPGYVAGTVSLAGGGVPSLVGLRTLDAVRSVASAAAIKVSVNGPRGGYVESQRPAGGTRLPDLIPAGGFHVWLTSVPITP
jgi:hypothetical protein